MIRIVAQGIAEAQKELAKQQKQIPFATALGMTRTAKIVEAELVDEMRQVFDRPTRWTLNSLRVYQAKKNKLEARVWMKNEATKGQAPTEWLAPQIQGGGRTDKGSERNLRRTGKLPAGKYIAPGKGAKLNSHGNMTKGQITKALSGVRGFDESGFDANATGSRRSRGKGNAKKFFVMRRGQIPIGIAQRTGSRLEMMLAFVSRPSYRKRLDFYGVGNKVIAANLEREIVKALKHAMATAR